MKLDILLISFLQLLLGVINYISTSLTVDDINVCISFTIFFLLISVLSIQYNHLAAFFNRDVNAQWMKFNQELLVVVLKVLETTETTANDDIRLILSALNYLHLITDCQSWKALQKNMSMFNTEYSYFL